jgi:hypothetical protein
MVEDGGVVGVIVIAGVGHHAVDPGGVVGGDSGAGAPDGGLRGTAPGFDKAEGLRHPGGGVTREGTGQGVEKVGLRGSENGFRQGFGAQLGCEGGVGRAKSSGPVRWSEP